MNVTTQVRRSSVASTLAVAALVIAACSAEEPSPEASESTTEGTIELTMSPNPVTFNETDTAEYTAEWKAETDGTEQPCEFVLSVTDPADQVIHSVPVSGCKSSMTMSLVDGAGDMEAGEYIVDIERGNERTEAAFMLEK